MLLSSITIIEMMKSIWKCYNILYGDEIMKKFNRNMLAHINVANKQSTQTVEQKSINTNKKGIMDLEKYGVIL